MPRLDRLPEIQRKSSLAHPCLLNDSAPLEAEPDLRLEPEVAARIFARYFRDREARAASRGGSMELDHSQATSERRRRRRKTTARSRRIRGASARAFDQQHADHPNELN